MPEPGDIPTPQPDELVSQGLFHVEVPDPSKLYDKLGTALSTGRAIFPMGQTTAEEGLFSGVKAFVIPFPDGKSYRAEIQAAYDNNHVAESYWTQDQIQAVADLLKSYYGEEATRLEHYERGHNALFIEDGQTGAIYSVLLGYEQERKRVERGMEAFHTKKEDVPDAIAKHWEEMENREFQRVINPDPVTNLDFMITLLDKDGNKESPAKLGDEVDFTRKIKGFGQVIEKVINAGAQIKGIPQPGTLTLS